MKKRTIQLLMLLIIAFTNFSCSKDREKQPKIEIDEKNLTACPENANCQYLFTENADVNEGFVAFQSGAYRVFWADIQISGMSTKLYIKAPMQKRDFSLGKDAILSNRVKLVRICANCLMTPFISLSDASVKGINLTPDRPADQTKWLLEINLVLASEPNAVIKQTVTIKQYFYPNFVYN